MTNASLANRASVLNSTVVLKIAMALTGVVMVLYLLLHMYGNLMVFGGQEVFDNYSHHIRLFGEPILPPTGFLTLMRIALGISVVVHIFAVVVLWRRARKATGGTRYRSGENRTGVQRSYASFTMRWGGVIIALFIVYHLLHLTTNTIAPGGASDSPYERVVNGFQIWWVVLSYVIALVAVGFHLRHGIWSGVATLGANTPGRERAINIVATGLALIVTIGFLLPPIAILVGVVK